LTESPIQQPAAARTQTVTSGSEQNGSGD